MTQALTPTNGADVIERVVIVGDLKELTPSQRVDYYRKVCESVGLNPLTKPFDYLNLQGRLTLYARKDATDQLRRIHKVSTIIVSRDRVDDVYVVTARATMADGRTDESIGAVNIAGLKGDALANALMKAETKAKRRVTLSICGLGWLDETEIETIPGAGRIQVDTRTGEIAESADARRMALIEDWKALRAKLRTLKVSVPNIKESTFQAMSTEDFAADIREMTEHIADIQQQSNEELYDELEAAEAAAK
jgi:hypothetical protein